MHVSTLVRQWCFRQTDKWYFWQDIRTVTSRLHRWIPPLQELDWRRCQRRNRVPPPPRDLFFTGHNLCAPIQITSAEFRGSSSFTRAVDTESNCFFRAFFELLRWLSAEHPCSDKDRFRVQRVQLPNPFTVSSSIPKNFLLWYFWYSVHSDRCDEIRSFHETQHDSNHTRTAVRLTSQKCSYVSRKYQQLV